MYYINDSLISNTSKVYELAERYSMKHGVGIWVVQDMLFAGYRIQVLGGWLSFRD